MSTVQDQAYIGRQPILDSQQQIIAYELFFRDSAEAQTANFKDSTQACVRVLVNTLNEIGSKWLLGDKLAFINVSESMLQSEFIELLPPQSTVLELEIDQIDVNQKILTRCSELKALGFRFALKAKNASFMTSMLLDATDFVKFDIHQFFIDDLAKLAEYLAKKNIKTIAEKVETKQQFEDCKEYKINYVQGFYFAQPETFASKVINPAFSSVLDLLNMVNRDAELNEIEVGFKRDAALTFKLLRYINSVGFGLSCEIQSIRHALTIIGSKQLYRWLTLLMVTAGENAASPALMKTSVTRGRLTELLGESYFDKSGRDNLFVVGVFSLLDSMMKMPMDEILEKIDIQEDIRHALLTREGVFGPFLSLAEACESEDDTRVKMLASNLQLDPIVVNDCHIAALAWAEELGV